MINEEIQLLTTNIKQAITHKEFSVAEQYADELLTLLSGAPQAIESENFQLCSTVLIEYIFALRMAGNSQQALSVAKKSLSIAEQYGSRNAIAELWTLNGLIHKSLSDYPLALEFLRKALATYEDLGEQLNAARVKGNIAIIHASFAEYEIALENFNQSLAIHEKLGHKQHIARDLGNIGLVYETVGDYQKAMEYFTAALAISDELGITTESARVTGNIGNIYLQLEDYPRALEFYTSAYQAFESSGIKTEMARILGNIGSVYKNMLEPATALEFYQKALASHQASGNKSSEAAIRGNMGDVYLQLEEYERAFECFSTSLAIHQELGTKSSIALHTGNIGSLYSTKKYEGYDALKAEKYLLESIAMCEEIGLPKTLYEVYRLLAALYEQEGKYAQALYYHKQFYQSEKGVLSEETKKQAEKLGFERKQAEREKEIAVERATHEATKALLHNVLPPSITDRLLNGEQPIADRAEHVSIFFSDIIGFTTLSQKISAKELVSGLNELFIQFDILARKHGLEKIKTIGDAYMAVCGVPVFMENHAERMAQFAIEIQKLFHDGITIAGHTANIRIGLHCGEVVAGVIGEQKFAYDLWGDAVNTANRMESHGEEGKIHVSEEFKTALVGTGRDLSLHDRGLPVGFIPRGEINIKGKGMMKTFYLESRGK